VAVAISAATLPAFAQGMSGPGPWSMHDGWFGWWPLGGLVWLLFAGLAIVGLVTAMRWLFGERRRGSLSSGAFKVLDERYARGEIDREEYLRRRKDIGGD
jgi:putative membrane protein